MPLTTRRSRLLAGVLAVGLLAVGCSDDDDEPAADDAAGQDAGSGDQERSGDSRLETVKDRGKLVCGVNDGVPGFGVVDDQGDYAGFDIDYCKVIAAAVLGDADAVEYRPISAEERFTALEAGEIDVLSRNTTWTASRDGAEGADFVTTTFYDGQGMMVKADSGFASLDDMDGTTICVLSGTTTEQNLATVFDARGLGFEGLTFDSTDQIRDNLINGQCDGWTSDLSQLAGVRSVFPESAGGPDSLVIFDEAISKEPLGPLVAEGDDDWRDAVNWAVLATIQAEELGIDSGNVEARRGDDDPAVRAFLGQPSGEDATVVDPGLGLDVDFAVAVVSQVGNYAEIFDRNVGPGSPLGLERGLNALWNAERPGLLYAPPYR